MSLFRAEVRTFTYLQVLIFAKSGAALIEPLAVAMRALENGDVSPQSTVLILGGGPIGLAILPSIALGYNQRWIQHFVLQEPKVQL